MPAFVDTGLNIVHVDDVAAGRYWHLGMVKSASAISLVAKIYRCGKFWLTWPRFSDGSHQRSVFRVHRYSHLLI